MRNPGEPFRVTNTLTEYVAGTARNSDLIVVFSKLDKATGQFRNLVRYIEPPRDAGKMVLLDGTSCGSTTRRPRRACASRRSSA